MYIPFNEMPDHARVWVYQANRELSNVEVEGIQQLSQVFSTKWTVHGQPLKSSVDVLYNRFVILSVDEQFNQASGCSIDSSVALIRELEEKFGTTGNPLSFFDRTQIPFLTNNNVNTLPLKDVKAKIANDELAPETLTFNNLVNTKGKLNSEWVVPAGQSWLSQFFKKVASN